MCIKPYVKNYTIDKDTGKICIDWSSSGQWHNGHVITINCGKCVECQIAKVNEWATRIMLEASQHNDNCAITLTYRDDNRPFDLNKKDLQDFIKRLFKNNNLTGVKRFYCGEYGSKSGNAHYHLILFGWKPSDMEYFFSKSGEHYYKSKVVERDWKHGYILVGNLTYKTARYCAKYLQKQCNDKYEYAGHQVMPFIGMSRRPGIASFYASRVDYNIDKIYINGNGYHIPRYFDKLNFKDNEELEKSIKASRLKSLRLFDKNIDSYVKLSKFALLSPVKRIRYTYT